MHPFGGIPICPRCSKQVYAAEQVMGPGRKLYHKPCLACTICSKRLDSRSLLEHDQLPYCQSCHIKNFGTRDLRHGNLPHKDDSSSSPTKTTQALLPLPLRLASPTRPDPPAPLLKPTRSLATSPTGIRSPTFPRNNADVEKSSEKGNETDSAASSLASSSAPPPPPPPPRALSPSSIITANSGRHGQGKLPRTVPLGPTRSAQPLPTTDVPSSVPSRPVHNYTRSLEIVPTASGLVVPTATGTRYGALLNRSAAATSFASVNLTGNAVNGPSSSSSSSSRRWGTDTPSCPRCTKNVYFAEQVRAVGKIYHKGCLRCLECQTLLDSSRLRDHDGEPYCVRCYGKLHGPQGSGYALLGKAGG